MADEAVTSAGDCILLSGFIGLDVSAIRFRLPTKGIAVNR